MSVKEYWEEECSLCGAYHCDHYFCYNCLIRYAREAGADEAKLRQVMDGILKKDYISDLKSRIKRVEKEPDREAILNKMYQELAKAENKEN